MSTPAAKLGKQLDLLEKLYGEPRRPPPRKALDWILWENAAYLQPDEKRARAYRELKRLTGLTGAGIAALPPHELLAWARMGGMLPEARAAKLREIAELVVERFGGDLEAALDGPVPKARAALKRFPGIGDPGAEKILLFTGRHPFLALESNGLRVLLRLGYGRQEKGYSATYRGVQRALASHVDQGLDHLTRAYELLRRHGQELCKSSTPRCDACPLAATCPSAE